VENPTTTGVTTTGAATGGGPPSRVPVSYEVASLSTLFEALATLDQDYVLTVDHENDIASAFRNVVIKMAQTQVANSESKYAVFLEWCRQPETKPLLTTLQLLDVFGSDAQTEAQRSTRGGGASPIDLATVFRWQGECEDWSVKKGV